MALEQGVLVIGETSGNHLSSNTAELLSAAQHLSQPTATPVALALLGEQLEAVTQEAIQAGADNVYTVEQALLSSEQSDLCLAAYQAVCETVNPDIILVGRTSLGRELAPRLACRLGVSVIQDCLEIDLDSETGQLSGIRPVYGGNVLARIRCTKTPQIATLRPKAYAPLAPDDNRQGEVISVAVSLEADMARSTVLNEEIDQTPGVRLEDARVVISGGRGLGGPEPFTELQELAGLLEAGIGASRAAVDAGWAPGNWQIGLTGKTITPELYITVGISGASQHMAGCSSAKMIIAINKDREANIFRSARYGIVGEWQTVIPAFIQAIRDLQ